VNGANLSTAFGFVVYSQDHDILNLHDNLGDIGDDEYFAFVDDVKEWVERLEDIELTKGVISDHEHQMIVAYHRAMTTAYRLLGNKLGVCSIHPLESDA
jgi:hypothetical protein